MVDERVDEMADYLFGEGYFDDDVDARHAAIRLIAALEQSRDEPAQPRAKSEPGRQEKLAGEG